MENRWIVWLVVGLLPLMTSCAGSPLVLGPVGPETSRPVEAVPTGFLKVYSATENRRDRNMHYFPHTSYSIWSEDGRIAKKVANAIGVHDEDPTLVEIPAGTYTVRAESDHYGLVNVKVVIDPGKLTMVNLERSEPSRGGPTKGGNDVVRLPNGSIVGWRAEGSSQANTTAPARTQ